MPVPSIVGLVLAACTGSSSGEPAPPPQPDPLVAAHGVMEDVRARVANELDCAESVVRYLCAATVTPEPSFELPDVRATWLGITIAVRRSRTMQDGAMETAGLSQLTLGPDYAWVSSLRPSNSLEVQLLGQVRANVSLAAKGSADRIEVPQSLWDYLHLEPEQTWPAVKDAHGWAFRADQPLRVYHVPATDGRPSAFVALEVGPGGSFLSVFPDTPWSVP